MINIDIHNTHSGKLKSRYALTKENCSVYAFGCLYLYAMLKSTMLYGGIFKYISLSIMVAGFSLVAFNIAYFKHRYNTKQIILMIAWLLLALLLNIKDYHGTTFDEYIINLVFYIVLGFTINNTDFDKITDVAYYISLAVIPLIMILARAGLIENLVYWRQDGMMGNRRESFGFGYPTDFASHIFYWMLLHFYRKRGKMSIIDYALFSTLAIFIDYFCDARLTVICTILLIAVSVVYQAVIKQNRFAFLWKGMLYWITPICALASWVAVLAYRSESRFMKSLDNVLSNRLSISKTMLNEYGVKIFGQYFRQHGYGATTDTIGSRNLDYTYVDMSFIRLVMMFGVVFFAVLLILVFRRMKKYVFRRQYLIPVIMLVVSIASLMDQHFMDFSYNVFLLTVFITTESKMTAVIVPRKTYRIIRYMPIA